MNSNEPQAWINTRPPSLPSPLRTSATAAFLAWVVMSLGFLGLRMLMQERPEFVGQPMRFSRTVLVQDAPRVYVRSVKDDVSLVRSFQPESAEIVFDMKGRRDYRGLKTISDMSGTFSGRFTLANTTGEALHVLFQCPHPRDDSLNGDGPAVAGLRLNSSVDGLQESSPEGWLWSGRLDAGSSAVLEVSYQAGALKGARYNAAGSGGQPVQHVAVSVKRTDLDSMRFESGEGAIAAEGDTQRWEKSNFLGPDYFAAHIVEGRNLFTSLSQLVEIGPLICLLFLAAVVAVFQTGRGLTALQTLTISAGYALYFPLILYLSVRFTFAVALTIALLVPGILLLNYARCLTGHIGGLVGGVLFLLLYQVFPTLAAFAGWNRGMLLLCLGVVTLAVLINLQNRSLKNAAAAAVALLASLGTPHIQAAGVHMVVPMEVATELDPEGQKVQPLIYFGAADYLIAQRGNYFDVTASLPLEIIRPGNVPESLTSQAMHLQTVTLEAASSAVAQLVTMTNRLALLANEPGKATLLARYRAPILIEGGKQVASVPMFSIASGRLRVESPRNALDVVGGSIWNRTVSTDDPELTIVEAGVAGEDAVLLEWSESTASTTTSSRLPDTDNQLYGIGLRQARHLTVINSDGSCTHFSEYELPATQRADFQLRIPAEARLISASINGTEISAPTVDAESLCRVPLPPRSAGTDQHRVSFRLALPPVQLGFLGTLNMSLPEAFQTTGTLDWVIALPEGFLAQLISSDLQQHRDPAQLEAFGDYGNVIRSYPYTHLAKSLAPPGAASAHLRYRQILPAVQP
ncbi:MAG: hypothetical protein RI897_61 [Verrucomicrobiota bacterium]|jgi:hypothetical protein